jgi:hypothetical protein
VSVGRALRAIARHVGALAASWRGRFILAFVVIQALLPLAYYTTRRDPHDERFAWRMFSPMRMARCTPHVTIDGKPFQLGSAFHEAWMSVAARGRFDVIEAMGAKLCAAHPDARVEVALDCTYEDRDPVSWGGYDICQVPQL